MKNDDKFDLEDVIYMVADESYYAGLSSKGIFYEQLLTWLIELECYRELFSEQE